MIKKTFAPQVKKYYSPEEKKRIVQDLRSGLKTVRDTSRKYRLTNERIAKWNRWYAKTQLLSYFRQKFTPPMADKDKKIQQLQHQLKHAKQHIDRLEVTNEALQMVIELAEKQLGMDIRKKSGSK